MKDQVTTLVFLLNTLITTICKGIAMKSLNLI